MLYIYFWFIYLFFTQQVICPATQRGRDQRLWEFTEEKLQEGGEAVGVHVCEVDVCALLEDVPEPLDVLVGPGDAEEAFHVQRGFDYVVYDVVYEFRDKIFWRVWLLHLPFHYAFYCYSKQRYFQWLNVFMCKEQCIEYRKYLTVIYINTNK